jgi:septum formation inhibitor MinC
MSAIEDRERVVLVDLSHAESSADAVRQLEAYLDQERSQKRLGAGSRIELNTGDLLLTPGVLAKMTLAIRKLGLSVETLYSVVPQTQQSALDEGLLVRQKPPNYMSIGAPRKFSPEQFINQAYKDLDLPFENLSSPERTAGSEPQEPLTRLSVTLDDGTREEVERNPGLSLGTVFYKQNLRSGQVLEASGNIVVVGDAHSGSEILADGDILVWGFLGGIAHAGRQGNDKSEIRAIRIEAVQLRIGHYIARRPDRLFKLGQAKKHRAPEVARVRDGEIQIYEDIVER